MPTPNETTLDEQFERECAELANKIVETIVGYQKAVAICVVPGVVAAIARTFGIPREAMISIMDSAMEDIDAGR